MGGFALARTGISGSRPRLGRRSRDGIFAFCPENADPQRLQEEPVKIELSVISVSLWLDLLHCLQHIDSAVAQLTDIPRILTADTDHSRADNRLRARCFDGHDQRGLGC